MGKFDWVSDDVKITPPESDEVRAFITRRQKELVVIVFSIISNKIQADGRAEVIPGDEWEGYTFKELQSIDLSIDNQLVIPKPT